MVEKQQVRESSQIFQPPKAISSFHFALSNVTDQIVDTSRLVRQNDNAKFHLFWNQ